MLRSGSDEEGAGRVVARIRVNGRLHELDCESAFSYAHTLAGKGHPVEAAEILRSLLKARPGDRQARLLLAESEAKQDHYRACMEILDALFSDRGKCLTAEFQAAFVFHNLGMTAEAAREMSQIVNQYKDLPTACLFLGDMLAAAGRYAAADSCWRLAIGRDRPGGAVARAACQQIGELRRKLAADRP